MLQTLRDDAQRALGRTDPRKPERADDVPPGATAAQPDDLQLLSPVPSFTPACLSDLPYGTQIYPV